MPGTIPVLLRGGGGDRAEDERDPGERQEVRDEAGDPGSQGVAVVEGTVREAGRDANRLYRVAEDAQGQERDGGPSRAEVTPQGYERGQGYEEGGDEGAHPRAGSIRKTDGEVGGAEEEGARGEQESGRVRALRGHAHILSQSSLPGLVYLARDLLAALPYLAAGALDQHRRPRRGRGVAYGRSVAMGGPAAPRLAHAAVQPPDLRRQRRLRPGDRRQKPTQGLAGGSQDPAGRGSSHLARRPANERAVPDLLPLRPAIRGHSLAPPLHCRLRRLFGPTLTLQGAAIPRLFEQRGLRLPARLRPASTRGRGLLAGGPGSDGLERGQAHLRRGPGRGRGAERGDLDDCRTARRTRRGLLERGVVAGRHGLLRTRKPARGAGELSLRRRTTV